jgi:hypothetical protein
MKTDRLPGDPGLPPGVSQKDIEGTETETKAEERERIAEEKADMEED